MTIIELRNKRAQKLAAAKAKDDIVGICQQEALGSS